jgi:hypothetical protein
MVEYRGRHGPGQTVQLEIVWGAGQDLEVGSVGLEAVYCAVARMVSTSSTLESSRRKGVAYDAKWQPVLNMTVGYGSKSQCLLYLSRLRTIWPTNSLRALAIMNPMENPVGCAAGATKSNRRRGPRPRLHFRSMSRITPALSVRWSLSGPSTLSTHPHNDTTPCTAGHRSSGLDIDTPPTYPGVLGSGRRRRPRPSHLSTCMPPSRGVYPNMFGAHRPILNVLLAPSPGRYGGEWVVLGRDAGRRCHGCGSILPEDMPTSRHRGEDGGRTKGRRRRRLEHR